MLDHHSFSEYVNIIRVIKQIVKYLVGFLGVWVLYLFAKQMNRTKIRTVFKAIGDYSYDIYLMHNPYIVAVVTILCAKFLKLPAICAVLIATFLGLSLPTLISREIIRRSRFLSMIMIGR